jgi:hypothetical protein
LREAEKRQRQVRHRLARIEHALEWGEHRDWSRQNGEPRKLEILKLDLIKCQAQVLWERPEATLDVIDSIEEASQVFMDGLQPERRTPIVERFQLGIPSRLRLYRRRWKGIEIYANTSIKRIETQNTAVGLLNKSQILLLLTREYFQLYNLMTQMESRLNLQIARDQKMLANTTKREAEAMKGISLLGAVFLPGTFIAVRQTNILKGLRTN